MSKFAILGSGFGLYGYLPALIDGCAQRIVLPERYRTRFLQRPELAHFADDVEWRPNENSALDCANGAALALPPINQREWIPYCLARSNIQSLFLEKPLAPSPELAAVILDNLIRSRKMFRVGYIFRFTTWGKHLLSTLMIPRTESGSLSIHWSFLAHHFRYDLRNWKRFNATGGAAIRFYGIQIIALLAELGYYDVTFSRAFGVAQDEVEKWNAVFAGSGLPECKVTLDTRATARKFLVEQAFSLSSGVVVTTFADRGDPFDSESSDNQSPKTDNRVPLLIQLCHSLCEEGTNQYEFYDATIKLWQLIEEKTKFEFMKINS